MSLQHQAGNAGSTGKKGFMSRLRAAGGSVSSAHVFNPPSNPANAMSTSGSWSIVDAPTPIKEQSATTSSARTVHLAFTTLANEGATRPAQGLVARASSSLLPTLTQEAKEPTEQVHTKRLDAAGLSSLISATNPEALYVGSARPAPASEALLSYLEEVLTSNSPLKLILLEPTAVRHLTPAQASSLHELARSRSIILLLPIRWNSLWTASIEETLLGLEILHDVQDEAEEAVLPAVVNGEADVSVDKSFDVSMSNIPTGLSGDGLDRVAELEAVRREVAQLKREVGDRDRRIAELNRQVEEQNKRVEQQGASKEVEGSGLMSTQAVVVEPRTPVRSSIAEVATPAAPTQTVEDLSASTARTPTTAGQATPATNPVIPTPSTLPVPSTSPHLAATSSPTPTATLAPAAPILSPPRHPPPSSPTSLSSRSTNVIASLTAELTETKLLLESTRSALTTVKTQSAAYQASADEMRATLSRARLENDSSITILARKDRQISEALERARKAEGEAKELGRASREWGTRIREVEEELGKERIRRSRAEQAYETLSNEWKTARTRLVEEVKTLKVEHRQAVDGLREEYAKVLLFKQRLTDESTPLPPSSDTPNHHLIPPSSLITQLTNLNSQMHRHLNTQLQPLLDQLNQFEARENREVVDKLKMLTDELTRIKTLMRRGDVVDACQVPPGPF